MTPTFKTIISKITLGMLLNIYNDHTNNFHEKYIIKNKKYITKNKLNGLNSNFRQA